MHHITYLTGVIILKPVDYTLYRMSDGSGRLYSEFGYIEGEYKDLLLGARMAGMKVVLS